MPDALSDITILVPGALHPRSVQRIGERFTLRTIDRSDPSLLDDELRRSVRGVAAMTGIDAAFIDSLPRLEVIANFGVGYDAVDARHAATRGIVVTNTPDVLTEEVADTALGLLLGTLREFFRAEQWLRDGRWVREGAYPLSAATLRDRSVGIVGMGRIGQAIARRLEAFGVTVSYHNRNPVDGSPYRYYPTLLGLAEAVDTLVSVAPGGATTARMVNADVLRALGPTGVFVNVGRGSTVDEEALISALRDGTILAAGLDVFADEPRVPQALIDLPNAMLLPHVGSASVHTRNAMADLVADNIIAWFSTGRPKTPVSESRPLLAR